jgi:hypothetical protein
MNKISKRMSVLMVIVLFLTNACRANVSRNGDGSYTVETTITQQELQEAITTSIADPLVKELNASLQSGYVLVTGTRQRLNDASKMDTLSFRVDLGVSNGQLTATISNAQIDNVTIEQNRVDLWNQTLANRLSNIRKRKGNNTLQSVSITPDIVTMTWNVVR